MQPLEPDDPRTVGPYRLLRRLGAGGMGRVYLGRSPSGRTVAVKVVHPHYATDEQFRRRFRREVASARRVGTAPPSSGGADSPAAQWTAPVLDADPGASTPWIATGYVAGPSVQQAVGEHGPLPERSVRILGGGLAEALRHVHGLGLVHRDVKPSNVMLTPGGPRLIDFGIARATAGTASITSTGASIGSPGYMSPEQVLGEETGPASDVFSLGAVLVYAATGEAPFRGDSSAVLLYKVVHEEPELGSLSGELREIAASCLEKDPGRRPSPARLAELPAGEDAAGTAGTMMRDGWLPAPIVEQISRRVIELLDLEPSEQGGGFTAGPAGGEGSGGGPAGTGPESGPVPFTTPSETPLPTRQPQQPPATAGRPDAADAPDTPYAAGGSYGGDGEEAPGQPDRPGVPERSWPSWQPAPSRPAEAPAAAGVQPGEANGGAPDGAASGGGVPAAPPARPGIALTASAERSRRQVSCSLVLTVACLLAVALLGTYFFQFLPGGGGDAGAPGPPSDSHAGDSRKEEVPAGFAGTWQGRLVFADGESGGTMRITFEEGAAGREAAHGGPVEDGTACDADYELDAVGDGTLRMTPSAPDGPGVCADGRPVEFTLRDDGTLRYTSRASGPGEPGAEATLRKVE
ncbi:Serine/threonine protein kinase [Streptomyces sp. WMMB 714]|uniref:serine/threonine-protein kinase n=1 Tax=Streptomyces sp. WMMB 714 TaxID=1286822 RepID=UPI0005F80810|nr:serine/threonine-protein kinase [Streptomyces sp. WMMB 714]SCK56211.1 Serine/threonine protein kinase [Streptomyces sp. WMMB 714]